MLGNESAAHAMWIIAIPLRWYGEDTLARSPIYIGEELLGLALLYDSRFRASRK